jgi:Xaa-Pro aminopeptidase
MPLGNFLAIQEGLPRAEFTDGSEVLRRLRMIKSDAEIEMIRQATEAIDRTFEVCFEEIEAGMTEQEVVDVCNRLVSENGARPVWTLASSAPGAILPQPDEPLEEGDTVFLDIGATVGGYHSDYNRMATVGEPSDTQRERCGTIAEITQTLVETIEPDATPADVVEKCFDEFDRRDLEGPPGTASPTKIGHSIGLTLSEAPQVTGYDRTPLEPGMVLCLEPALIADDGIYITEEIAVVTEDGAEVISGVDTGLYQI